MDAKTFDKIFDPLAECLGKKPGNEKYAEILRRSKVAIRNEYISIREFVKTKYMEDPVGKLDRHKCAASFMVACMKKMNFDGNTKDEGECGRLAITIGLTVLRIFIVLDNRNYDNAGLIALLSKNNGFKFPPTICDDKPYHINWAHELFHGLKEDKLLVLSLAHELFWIETYNTMLSRESG